MRFFFFFFFFDDTATTEIYTLSLHDALPTSSRSTGRSRLRSARRARRSSPRPGRSKARSSTGIGRSTRSASTTRATATAHCATGGGSSRAVRFRLARSPCCAAWRTGSWCRSGGPRSDLPFGKQVEDGKDAVHRETRPDVHESERKRNRVGNRTERVAPGDRAHRDGIGAGIEQPPSRDRVPPHGVVGERDYDEGRAIGRDGDLTALGERKVLGENRGRKRQERDAHEEEDMDQEKVPIRAADVRKDRMVVRPHDPERHEADDVPQVGGPELRERPEEASLRSGTRYFDLEDQERDRDGEDAVRKRLEPRGLGEARRVLDSFGHRGVRPDPTSSDSLKKKPTSRAALSGESLPWIAFLSMSL